MMKMIKRLVCKIFGHSWSKWFYDFTQYTSGYHKRIHYRVQSKNEREKTCLRCGECRYQIRDVRKVRAGKRYIKMNSDWRDMPEHSFD